MAAHDVRPRRLFEIHQISLIAEFKVSNSDMPDVLLAQITLEVLIDQCLWSTQWQ